jgi:hypothetical protein
MLPEHLGLPVTTSNRGSRMKLQRFWTACVTGMICSAFATAFADDASSGTPVRNSSVSRMRVVKIDVKNEKITVKSLTSNKKRPRTLHLDDYKVSTVGGSSLSTRAALRRLRVGQTVVVSDAEFPARRQLRGLRSDVIVLVYDGPTEEAYEKPDGKTDKLLRNKLKDKKPVLKPPPQK